MAAAQVKASKRLLEPHERIAEVLFGLIMVLTFTGSLSVAEAGREDIRTMLVGALGCNIAWGVIDGVLYLMSCLAEKSRSLATLRAVRQAADPGAAQRLVADLLPSTVASVVQPAELDAIGERLKALPEPPERARLSAADALAALAVFLWVFFTTFPVTIPFLFMTNSRAALRVSNGVAVLMLFATGCVFGRLTGGRRWTAGVLMVLLGVALVALTMALGG